MRMFGMAIPKYDEQGGTTPGGGEEGDEETDDPLA